MFENFTDQSIKVVLLAQEEARRMSQSSVGTEQLLLGLLREQSSLGAQVLVELGLSVDGVREVVSAFSKSQVTAVVPADIPFTPKSKQILEQALQEAQQMADRHITPNHLLLSLTRDPNTVASKVLLQLGIEPASVRHQLIRKLGETVLAGRSDRASQGQKTDIPALEAFGVNLTELAQQGKLDPLVGREAELERVVQILGRRRKNNPLLLGEPGVGKTAIAEGIAQRIIQGAVPPEFREHQVIRLDLTALGAGTRLRGEFEERLYQVVDEVKQHGKIILAIDEIHTLLGAGAYNGGVDAANLLKPALARGELQCLGATTLEEYRQYFERDEALTRRFQTVYIDEPQPEEALEILYGLRSLYELHHRVTFSNEALQEAVRLSCQYISDRHLPDKAIDVMDEAGSRIHLQHYGQSQQWRLKQDLFQTRQAKEQAVALQNFEEASRLRDREIQQEEQLKTLFLLEDDRAYYPQVQADDIAQVVSAWTGVPVTQLSESESDRFLHLDDLLHERVVGQDAAVKAVAKALKRSRVGLKDPKRPIASFIFAGPTGVGKTELAKTLAVTLFGSEEALIRLDMSEFMDRAEVSKLIGAPPGFVGYDEGGLLTEAVRRRPYSVVLFDEIEKAHPDIFNILLQLLDDGRLTDSQGRVVDFKNTILLMTSNLGAKAIEKGGQGLGFDWFGAEETDQHYQQLQDRVLEEFKTFFRPEFLNRVDETIVFRQLTQAEVATIADLLIAQVRQQLQDEHSITFSLSDRFQAHLISEGFSPAYGARPLRRAITRLVEDQLAEALLAGTIVAGNQVTLDWDAEAGRVLIQICPQTLEETVVFHESQYAFQS
ncbi:MAG: ATP-dependent Clp protease ATP-binding subunit [Prochlorotrichaceae cyanobacterium]